MARGLRGNANRAGIRGDRGRGRSEVRLRRRDGERVLTVKRGSGRTRTEEEIELEPEQFDALWPLTEGRRVRRSANRAD